MTIDSGLATSDNHKCITWCHAASGPPPQVVRPDQVKLLQLVPPCHKWSPYTDDTTNYKHCIRMFPAYGTAQLQTLELWPGVFIQLGGHGTGRAMNPPPCRKRSRYSNRTVTLSNETFIALWLFKPISSICNHLHLWYDFQLHALQELKHYIATCTW